MDILGPLPQSTRGNKYILVVGDYLSKWMEAYALPDQCAGTVAKKFVEEFVLRYGVPKQLHSDQGRNFESAIIAGMCSLLGTHKTRTTPYNPKSDGLVERFNRTLVDMVEIMLQPYSDQNNWDELLPYATFAYRTTPQESTGETPFMMMFGREAAVPVDLMVEPVEGDEPGDDLVSTTRNLLQMAAERARGGPEN